MNWFDHVLARVAPAYYVRGLAALAAARAYEAAKPGRLHKTRNDLRSADGVNEGALPSLRAQARYLDENHDLAVGILDAMENNIVGEGIWPEPMVKNLDGELHEDFNTALADRFNIWAEAPEVTGDLDNPTMQRLEVRTWLRDGEKFSQYLEGNVPGLDHITDVPFSIELLEADMVPADLMDERTNVIQGIQKNAWGRATGFHVYKEHPDGVFSSFNTATKLIPADRMNHLKLMHRIRQTRGATLFRAILQRMDDIKDYEESERVAARVAAAMTMIITKSGDYVTPDPEDSKKRHMKMAPGMIIDDLSAGESAEMFDSNRPNTGLADFRNAMLRAAAAGSKSSYNTISRNYEGSYSSQRQGMLEQHPAYCALRSYFVARSERDKYRRWQRMAILVRDVEVPEDVDLKTLGNVMFGRIPMRQLDPLKEVRAKAEAVDAGFSSVTKTIRDEGNDPREIRAQREAEKDWAPQLAATTATPTVEEAADAADN